VATVTSKDPTTPEAPRVETAAPEPAAAAKLVADAEETSDRLWAQEQLAVARSKVALELYDQAIGTLEALVARDGTSEDALDAYMLMASVHELRDEREDAIATYLDVAGRFPESAKAPEALFRMAETLLRSRRRGREAEALKVYGDVADRYPSWAPRALLAKGELEERLKLHHRDENLDIAIPSALATYRRLAASHPRSPQRETALWKLGQMYQRIKRFDLAADALTELAESFPASGHDPWFAAAEIYDKRLKVPASARYAYARVPSTSPRFDEAQKRLARQ
jgi:TolA-binding protein